MQLSGYLVQNCKDENLRNILEAIANTSVEVSDTLRQAPLLDLYGTQLSANASGEKQKKLDVISNQMFLDATKDFVRNYVSEENDEPVVQNPESQYNIYIDPLDGSSNIEVNIPVGTIFGISRSGNNLLVRGREYLCAGYVIYSAATSLVLTMGEGTHGFSLDPSSKTFWLSHRDVMIPKGEKIYSINEGYSNLYDAQVQGQLANFKSSGYKLRYVGSMVADIHRTLLSGGVFLYPSDAKNPNGKLRLMYELNPIAMLVEQAGGVGISNNENILDIVPQKIHERRPAEIGARK